MAFKYIKSILFSVSILIVFNGCFKQRALNELETQQIMSYIYNLGLDFDTLSSGVLFHKTYLGEGNKFTKNQRVTVIYDGYNLDEERYFTQNDTFSFIVGNKQILPGWNDVAEQLANGGAGIVIFPYNKAFDVYQTPDIPAYSTLIYSFHLLTENYRIQQNTSFWQYVEAYDSILTFYDDSLCYVKYFDGLGNLISSNNLSIDYSLYTINDSLITNADSFYVDFSNPNIATGLLEALSEMYEGEMGKIMIPPSLSYIGDNIYNLKPYTALYAVARIISPEKDVNQTSKINKYLFLNKITPDSILPSNIYYFVDKEAPDTAISPVDGDIIIYSDSLFLINHNYAISGCNECTATLNSLNFFSGKLLAIKAMKKGEEATFIIPYQKAYGSIGQGIIPPYATLVYKIKLTDIQ
ncbi:MAG: FKBP-type peptidyl-prolyl cis-trans isomerase [Bacteroidales bacterium]|nr:FKBP-type peptidyl-prolyl cis-trans isomerase [Bacteroidales bacterium]